MDSAHIRGLLLATLDPNADTRRQAELQLKQVEDNPGMMDALMDVMQSEQESSIRLATAIYIKNRVNRSWSRTEHYATGKILSEEEKGRFRDRLLPVLAATQGAVRQQLVPVLQRILQFDFPDKWPNFMDFTMQLLNTNDPNSVLAGLQCLLAICRAYRYRSGESHNRSHFDEIVKLSFPRLLAICNELVNQESQEAGEMLHLALKAYKHATWLELPPSLRERDNNIAWCTVFLNTVSKTPPAIAMAEDDMYEREKHPWWKTKKWAYFNLNRLFVRHGSPSAFPKSANPDVMRFAEDFITNIAPEILTKYLGEIEKWVTKTTWLSRPCLSYTLVFLDECVRPKEMWPYLKPHLNTLITHLVFPVICLSEEDLEKFEEEPEEYLHRKLNCLEEASAPDIAATNFLVGLTKARRTETFEILKFINAVVTEYEQAPDDKKNHIAKEGALRMIGTLAPVILGKKSPIADQVEYFLVRYVFPEFTSSQGYLRARACDVVEKFELLDFQDQNNLVTIYRHILDCMADPALPVRITAALALQPLIRHDIIRASMQQSIPTIMQQLLKLANEADVDALANVMEDFVEVFATELTPFAVALSEQLRDTYCRIVRELLEKNDKLGDDSEYSDYLDDKSITALGVLQTIGTLILTLESTPDVLLHIETVLMPVIQITLENKLYELYNEVFEIIDSCTFAAKAISGTMWKAFELIHATFKAGAQLYLEDMLPALDNFVQYGAGDLTRKPEYVEALYSMVAELFVDDNMSKVDRICGCKLAEAMMLSLRGHIDQWVHGFIEMAMRVLATEEVKGKSYKIHLMEMVISAMHYNPILTLQVLESKEWTNKFFSLWFGNMNSFARVHDKKLCVAAISSLLSIPAANIPASVSTGWPRLLQGIAELFRTLPTAVKNREEALKDDYQYDPGSYDYGADDEWADEDATWETEEAQQVPEQAGAQEPEAQADARDEGSAYLEFLNEEAQKFRGAEDLDSDDDLGEESLILDSPLDKIDSYQLFAATMHKIQTDQPQFYTELCQQITADDMAVIQGAVTKAEQTVMEQMALAQQQGANLQQQPPANGGAS